MVNQLTNRMLGIFAMMMLMLTLSLDVSAGNVTVKSGLPEGSVTVTPTTANPGATVTITVTPPTGSYCEKADVKAEKTIDGGAAQAPGRRAGNTGPGVGAFVEIQGDAPADVSGVATYTFTMPEAPYGVQVSAEFHERTAITQAMFVAISEQQEYTGQQITPAVQCADGYNLAQGTDYTIEYGDNVGPGAGTVTITGKGKYTSSLEMSFTIYRDTYEVRWGEGENWAETNVITMTKNADGKWVAADKEMAAGNSFKIVKKHEAGGDPVLTWYGYNDQLQIGTEIMLGDGNNMFFQNAGTYTFTFDPVTTKLLVTGTIKYNVTVTPTENATVTVDKEIAPAGDEVTITVANIAAGYTVSAISVTSATQNQVVPVDGESSPYTFTMPADNVTVSVTLTAIRYSITVTQGENGTIHADKVDATVGETVTLTAKPETDCVLEAFIVKDADNNTINVVNNTFTMPASNVTITATFTALDVTYQIRWGLIPENTTAWSDTDTHVITMTKNDDGKWVAADQEMAATSGFKVVRTVQDEDQWFGAEANGMCWITQQTLGTDITLGTGDDAVYKNLYFPNDGIYTFTYDPSNHKLVVTGDFLYHVTVAEGIQNGTVEVATPTSGKAKVGDPITINVTPNTGYQLKTLSYTVEGSEPVDIENNTFYMPAANVTINATFELVDYTITVADGIEHGTVTATPATAHYGEAVTITVTDIDPGYQLDALTYTVEGSAPVAIENNTFTMPAANVTINATFKLVNYTITVADGIEHGTVTATPATAHYGEAVTITVTDIDAGYELASLTYTVEGSEPVTIVNNTFNMPAANVTINATFMQTEVDLDGVTFTADRQWATYYNGTNNLVLPQGVQAYVVNSVVNDAVDITEISYIPAGVGVLLYSETAGEQLKTTIYTGETGTYTSMLEGSDEAQEITSGYVLYNNNFIRSEAGTVPAHRCYLPANQVAGAPRTLKIGVSDVVTAIESIIAQGNVAGIKYVNLKGMISNEPFSGINIAVITFIDGTTTTMKVVK